MKEVFESLPQLLGQSEYPSVKRLDWITSSGVIHNEIWEEIVDADLVFCDVTGCNPNVLFEAGVAATIKRTSQVVFIRDHFFRQQVPFDLAPLRYAEYSLTSDGLPAFCDKVRNIVFDAFKAYPDDQIESPVSSFPATIDFSGNHDDPRIYTPPLAHRRVTNCALEFGSTRFFSDSWASLGNARVLDFDLNCDMSFRNSVDHEAWIGVGFRSQHFWANYAHIFYLKRNGEIIITEPNESSELMFQNRTLRTATAIDVNDFHHFHVRFYSNELSVSIDDFSTIIDAKSLPKVLGPGLIRFQSSLSWVAIKNIQASET